MTSARRKYWPDLGWQPRLQLDGKACRNSPFPGLQKEHLTMTKLTFKGAWNEITGKPKQKYAGLTDDLLFAEENEEDPLGRLQKRIGQTKETPRKQIAVL